MNAVLEQAVYKYLRPTDEPISLTDTARRFESENPSYLREPLKIPEDIE